jgi:GNAT superfamily N-acetyltransferase
VLAIAEFQTTCWREAYRGLVPQDYLDRVSTADRERRWRQRLVTREREIALAESAAAVVGVVSWAAPPLELKSLYVAADHRGTGLAAALVDTAIGARAAQLWVFEGNDRAQAFYAKLGFVADGSRMLDPDTGLAEVRWVRPAGHRLDG